ncbi:MAG: HAD family phosphatase [bacterium]|nr:HAD family phosphatase [bacterium]
MIKGVIFDMDGLMIDSEFLNSSSISEVIKMYGKVPIIKENGLIHTVGLKGYDQWAEIKKTHQITESIDNLRRKRRRIYLEILKKEKIKIMSGLKELMYILKNKNVKLAVASNTSKEHIVFILKKISMFSYFHTIVSADEVKRAKPYPDIYKKVARQLGLKPSECIVLEDSQTGVLSAKRAGMFIIAVPSVFTKYQNFLKADIILPSLRSIKWKIISSFD